MWVKKRPTSPKGKSIKKGMEVGECERSRGNTVRKCIGFGGQVVTMVMDVNYRAFTVARLCATFFPCISSDLHDKPARKLRLRLSKRQSQNSK